MNLSILGSTGSIGTQTLDVARMQGYKVVALAARKNISLLEKQAREFKPSFVAVEDETAAKELKIALSDTDILVGGGRSAVLEAAAINEADTVLNSLVGISGLEPTLTAIDCGKTIALANKETVVAGGELVKAKAKDRGVKILPVDSEHSAIFQSLQGNDNNKIKRILLTASGGPFFGKKKSELKNVKPKDALKHPNWDMGQKITIDSATMMNKGLEVIEAVHLFDIPEDKIEVLVHRESIVHSMVEYDDNAVIAQLGTPDMRVPIQYALTYPNRYPSPASSLDLIKLGSLTFCEPDNEAFPCLSICRKAIASGGVAPAAVNGANEVAVARFLKEEIGFLTISEIAQSVLDKFSGVTYTTLEEILEIDNVARKIAAEF